MEIENDQAGQETGTDFDADSTLESIEAPSTERPMRAAPESPPAAKQTPTPSEDFEFNWNGKAIKANRDQVSKWAEMGYNAPGKIGELNKALEASRNEAKQLAALRDKYAPVDDYFTKNPDKWKPVEDAWKANTQPDPNDPMVRELTNLKTELAPIKDFINQTTEEKRAQALQKEDSELEAAVKSIRDTRPDLDWAAVDPQSGQTLEQQVLKHGVENGIKTFRAAFRDFIYEKDMKATETRGMEKRDNDIQRKTKLGLLGQTSTPTKALTPAKNIKNQSYNDLAAEALRELGIG